MSKLSFKISARTARLIGRQNFSNADGAIIELVKNCYDADASACIIVFDDKYATLPQILTSVEYKRFEKKNSLISKYYFNNDKNGNFDFNGLASKNEEQQEKLNNEKKELREYFRSQCKMFIVDNGEGMTDRIIEDFWMVIGTNNKEEEIYTRKKRIKTGAKGIGRFALDRLGDSAEMTTKPNPVKYHGVKQDTAFIWSVDWNAFEGGSKTIDEVKANLISEELSDFPSEIKRILPSHAESTEGFNMADFRTGTLIEINGLHDFWDDHSVGRLFENLEILIPPKEEREFDIFVFSHTESEKYGKVFPSICDDFDYKVDTRVDQKGDVTIDIYRNEYDLTKIDDDFFKRDKMKEDGFQRQDFERGRITKKRQIGELVPGLSAIDDHNILNNIGEFQFVFYFMKAQISKGDKEKFSYKDFNSAARKKWLDSFAGIKIFRDNFRVRPYGEARNPAFDWLDLGQRAAKSPAGRGKKDGGWKVRPYQISGTIHISRLTNIDFEDKSSREGLQENPYFDYFKQIIQGIIDIFESDIQDIGFELSQYYSEKHQDNVTEEIAKDTIRRVKTRISQRSYPQRTEEDKDADVLVKHVENLEKEIELLKDEYKLTKILASNALTIASFTHELRNIKENLVYRVEEAENLFTPLIDSEKLNDLPDFLNPFVMLESIKHDDEKLKEWLHYSLETLRKDKRRRKIVEILDYLKKYKASWKNACDTRGVEFKLLLPQRDELKIRVFEAELDSVFNNLLINSFEAFLRKDAPPERAISLELRIEGKNVEFVYRDTGPGFSPDIVKPEEWIFEPHTTTKKDPHTGEDTGTGLGMWLVKSLVEDNAGTVNLLKDKSGFGLHINLLNKVKE